MYEKRYSVSGESSSRLLGVLLVYRRAHPLHGNQGDCIRSIRRLGELADDCNWDRSD